jgi:quinol-cytochrome oxidoreductase complex cytochrome b subunit
MLTFLGGKPATAPYVVASQIFTFLYFFYFLVIVPIIPELEFYLLDYELANS